MRFNHKTSLCFSAVVFMVLVLMGISLSRHKLLWIDECYTQHVSVEKPSYADILTLNFPEGNRCPLFYILQKINSNVFFFTYPNGRAEGSFDVPNARAQTIIRIPSNIYMSLALAAIFYYFIRFFSLFTGIYAMMVALVSPMVWLYWVEARPYSLWFLLTTVQLLFFCTTVHSPKIKVNKALYLTHFLLILTTPGSVFQISIVTLMLFLRGKLKKRQLIWAFALPMCFFIFYYFYVPLYRFKTFYFFECLYEVAMPERLCVYVIYALTAWVVSKKSKEYTSNTFFLPIFLLFFICTCLVLFIHLFTNNFQFGFFNRYFIYLVPADILMFSFASSDLWKWTCKNKWVCMNVSIFLGGLLIIRGLMTYREVIASALYLHSPG